MIVKVLTTEPCPKCNLYISKDGGCHYMQCPKCTHEFCWFCLGHAPGHSHVDGTNCSPRSVFMYAPIILMVILLLFNPVLFVLKPIFSLIGFIFGYVWWSLVKLSPALLQVALFYALKYTCSIEKKMLVNFQTNQQYKNPSILVLLPIVLI